METRNERPQDPPRRGRPFRHAFVDVVAPGGRVEAARGKAERQLNHDVFSSAALRAFFEARAEAAVAWKRSSVRGGFAKYDAHAFIASGRAPSRSSSEGQEKPSGALTIRSLARRSQAVRSRSPSRRSFRTL